MPIYEYICRKCQRHFEELVFNQQEEVVCPDCGHKKVDRAMSTFAFQSGGTFRGVGDACGGCSKGSCSGCSSGS